MKGETVKTRENGEMRLVEKKDKLELRTKRGSIFSREVKNSQFSGGYWDQLALVPNEEESKKTLILGVGCGTLAKVMKNIHGNIEIHGVDIDPQIIQLGREKFNLEENTDKIHIEEAEKFLDKTKEKYSYIAIDCFKGKQVPPRIKTSEFIEKARNQLEPEGKIAFNIMLPMETREIKKNMEKVMNNIKEKKIKNIPNTILTARRDQDRQKNQERP